jgi:hypothetical protein
MTVRYSNNSAAKLSHNNARAGITFASENRVIIYAAAQAFESKVDNSSIIAKEAFHH